MTAIAQFVRTTVVGGLLFLAPIVVLIVILAKAFDYAKKGLVRRRCCSHSSRFRLKRWRGDGAGSRARRTRLLSCWTPRPHRDRAARHRRIGVVGAVEDSRLRLSEARERKRAGRRRDRGTPRGLRAHGRGMAARRSDRNAERRPRLDLRRGLARPAFRGGLFLFERQRSTCRHQAGRCAQLPQAMRRGRFRDRRYLAGQGIAPPRLPRRRTL